MSIWFEGHEDIECGMEDVGRSVADLGAHYTGIVSRMPGLTDVELVDQGPDHVTIKTSEGLMHRTNVATRIEPNAIVVECDERYDADSKVSATTHFIDEFTASESGSRHHLVMQDVQAPGFLGFLYRRFGSSRMGKAFLAATKAHLEKSTT